MIRLLEHAAEDLALPHGVAASMKASGCDAWNIAPQAGGIPSALVEVPLRYMHTGVEVISLTALESLERLLAAFLYGMPPAWKEALCWND